MQLLGLFVALLLLVVVVAAAVGKRVLDRKALDRTILKLDRFFPV